jgi:uncharacterized membrane protein
VQENVERARDFERFVSFVDAVVAIAITLLILPLVDVAVQLGDGSVTGLLADNIEQIGGFLLSFVAISALWFAQHRAIRTVVAHDPLVTRLMVAWVLTIVVLPFPTALVAQVGSEATTKIVYIGTMAISSILIALMCWAIGRNRSIRDSDERPELGHAVGTAFIFVLALAISLAVPVTGYYPLLLLLVHDPAAKVWARRKARTLQAERHEGE